jgi:hypothetical protein
MVLSTQPASSSHPPLQLSQGQRPSRGRRKFANNRLRKLQSRFVLFPFCFSSFFSFFSLFYLLLFSLAFFYPMFFCLFFFHLPFSIAGLCNLKTTFKSCTISLDSLVLSSLTLSFALYSCQIEPRRELRQMLINTNRYHIFTLTKLLFFD